MEIMEFAATSDIDHLIIILAFGFLQAVVLAIIGALSKRNEKKRKCENEELEKNRKEETARIDKRAKIRARESRLAMKLMAANAGLAMETARAIKNGSTNGEMDGAISEAVAAKNEYINFIKEIASEQFID